MSETHPSSPLRDRVLAAAAAQRSLTRREGRATAALLVAASIALAFTIFQKIGGLGHSAGRPLGITIAIAAGWIAVSSILTWLVVGRSGSTMARKPLVLLIATAITPLLVFVWLHLFSGTYSEPFQRVGYRCLTYTLIFAAVPLATFLFLKRAVEPRHPAVLG